MNKISLSQALDNTGFKKKYISEQLGFNNTYYQRFLSRGTVSRPQATVIELLTGIKIENIDVKVK